jgi:hypothetical protein
MFHKCVPCSFAHLTDADVLPVSYALMSWTNYNLRLYILRAVSMKIAVSCVIVPYSLVEVYRRFRGAFCHQHPGTQSPDDGDSKHL